MAGIGGAVKGGLDVLGAGLGTTGNILSMQADANAQIKDYRNWAFNKMAMQIQQKADKAQLQDSQARQTSSMQVGIGAGGLGLSSSNAINQQTSLSRAQGQEVGAQSINHLLQNMSADQAWQTMKTHYESKRTGAMVGGMSDMVNKVGEVDFAGLSRSFK